MNFVRRHRLAASLAALLLFIPLGASFMLPKQAHAQIPTTVTSDATDPVDQAIETFKRYTRQAYAGIAATFLIDLMSFAANRLAYDAAVAIASGGPGETALYDPTPPGEYFKQYGAAVAGEAVGLLQEDMEALSDVGVGFQLLANFNLCAPRADVLLTLNLGIKGAFERPEPKCDFKEVSANWAGFIADVQSVGEGNILKNQLILTQLADMYDERNNEFAVGLNIYSSVFSNVLEQSSINLTKHIQADGFQGVTDFITGNVATPSSLITKQYEDAAEQAKMAPFQSGLAILQNTDVLLQIGVQAGSVFTNTLLSELTKKLYSGLFDFDAEWPDPFGDIESIGGSNAATARDQFKSLLATRPLEITNYSILADFAVCPPNRSLYNCVADNQFITAVSRAEAGAPLTLEEAIEDGLIHGEWPIISSSDQARNQDPFCYTYGFCHGNLVKLRKARIISIGWELAAESPNNTSGDPATLQEVMDGFDDCNAEGLADGNHPWCKMIDPAWVLKYPETQCKALVNGQLLEATAADRRQQECVDMPSCIAEGDDGSCTGGFGYCVEEENVWRFRGEACLEQYASCLTFDGPEGEESYLQNTLDFGPCNEGNAGCMWYSTIKADPEGDGTFDFQPVADIEDADDSATIHEERIYFTSAVEECDASEGGCSQLVQRNDNLRLNVISNSSFEQDTNADGQADGWFTTGTARVNTTGNLARTGSAAGAPNANEVTQPGIVVSQGRFYTFSFYARQRAGAAQLQGRIGFTTNIGDINLRGTSITGCQVRDASLGGDGLGDGLVLAGQPAGQQYERFSCTFTSPILPNPAAEVTAFVSFVGDVAIDDVQLEQGENASAYHNAYSETDLSTIVAKVPPAYLGCDGSPDDPEACGNYAKVCSENDVGCTEYTPQNGDPAVTGIISSLDICPAECSGYDTYKQEPTLYEPEGVFPLHFIPDTAEVCSEEDVGCDEFTNLTTEGLEYYTYLRACVTEEQAAQNVSSDNAAVFYTWEGSDLSGFQLKTWTLLESNIGAPSYTHGVSGEVDTTPGLAPCSNATATANGMICSDAIDLNGNGVLDWDTALCDEHDDIFTNPDCREFYDSNGGIHYRLFSNTVTVNDACTAYRKTDLAGTTEPARQANCVNSGGFYDASVGTCRYYGYAEESEGCSANANGCRSYTGGRSRNSRIVIDEFFEDGSITDWDAGSAADATLSNESLATGGHSIAATGNFSTFFFDNGSVCNNPDGCDGTARSFAGTCTVVQGERRCGVLHNQLFTGKTYTVSFIAKGTGNLRVGFDLGAVQGSLSPADLPISQVSLGADWQTFTIGPIAIDPEDFPNFGNNTALVFDPSSLAYVDNIVLREGEDNITILKNSWETPASCDQSPTGASSPQYHLGCQEYATQTGSQIFAKSFSRLCDSDEVGCQDFFLTQESSSPYAKVFNGTCNNVGGGVVSSPTSCFYSVSGGAFDTTSPYLCTIAVGFSSCRFSMDWYVAPTDLPAHLTYGPETEIVPADQDIFLVINDDVTCSASAAGCEELGKPTFAQDRNSTTGAEATYLMNIPDNYTETLCSHEALFCSAWGTENDGTYYFKDPLEQACEYRTDVTIGGSTYDGWFRTGTDSFCYGTCTNGTTACSTDADCPGVTTCNTQDPSFVVGGDYSGIWRNGDAEYGGWVGTCPADSSTCSEFQDPLDDSTDDMYGTGDGAAYFYLNNNSLDENSLPDSQQCNGQVSLKEGCVLFNDTTEPSQGYNASATEIASRHADTMFGKTTFDLVEPVDCESGDSSITTPSGEVIDLCAKRCAYDLGAVNDITDGVLAPTKISNDELGGNTSVWNADTLYAFGGSCYTANDCAPVRSQAGEDVTGTCNTTVRVNPVINPSPRDPVPRLENDTNTVLKVNRDRQCSEWLACANPQTVWDERTNSFRTVCGDVEMCTEYSSLGNSSFCSGWEFDQPEVVLTAEEYVDRDVSWYGSDYSGYAIPDIFPVQTLTQANVAPPTNTCNLLEAFRAGDVSSATFAFFHGDTCSIEEDCGGDSGSNGTDYCVTENEEDFRLVLDAGSCDESYGSACSIGYCENTGSACSSTVDCGGSGGSCVTGSCFEIATATCASDSDCGEGQICLGASCAEPLSSVTIEAYNANTAAPCGSDTFAASVNLMTGSCIRNSCLLTPEGDQFDPGESEGKLCRAYPEVNSPFTNDIIERYIDSETKNVITADQATWDDEAYDVRSGFENVQLCAPGEECACSYKKVTFGEGANIKYFGQDFEVSENIGICTTGPQIGSQCVNDSFCGDGGTCSFPSKEDVLLGLDGYCLEKDTSISVLGDRAESACLTWLPVDQLAGSTDLYAKYTSAGYFDDTFACAFAAPFANLMMSDHLRVGTDGQPGDIACADFEQAAGQGDVTDRDEIDVCVENVVCPAGHWAMMSNPHYKDKGLGTIADACAEETGRNGCAYVCMPFGATIVDSAGDTQSCDPDSAFIASKLEEVTTNDDWEIEDGNVYVPLIPITGNEGDDVNNYRNFDDMILALEACSLKGVEVTSTVDSGVFNFPASSADDSYHDLRTNAELYPACKNVVQVADDSQYVSYAWTDRIYDPGNNFNAIESPTAGLDYTELTNPVPFGLMSIDPEAKGDEWPFVLAACKDSAANAIVPPLGIAPFNICNNPLVAYATGEGAVAQDPSDDLKDRIDPASPDGRTLVDFDYDFFTGWTTNGNDQADAFALLNQLFAAVNLGTNDNVFAWNRSNGVFPNVDLRYIGGTASASGYSDTLFDVRPEQGKPPTIWALDSTTCNGSECEEGRPDAFTLNEQDAGPQSAFEFFRAYIKFYAAADKNQLPIRRIIIDWGDGSTVTGSDSDDNFFKNHRGLADGTSQSLCDTEDEWGMTNESCDPNYFNYGHVYTCSPSQLLSGPGCVDSDNDGVPDNSPCVNNFGTVNATCSFVPKVHVRDNWGWCTGTCTGSAVDGTDGCYDGDGNLSSDTAADECSFERYDGSGTNDPWITYDGVIIVDPTEVE